MLGCVSEELRLLCPLFKSVDILARIKRALLNFWLALMYLNKDFFVATGG